MCYYFAYQLKHRVGAINENRKVPTKFQRVLAVNRATGVRILEAVRSCAQICEL